MPWIRPRIRRSALGARWRTGLGLALLLGLAVGQQGHAAIYPALLSRYMAKLEAVPQAGAELPTLLVESDTRDDRLSADVYAILPLPAARLGKVLDSPTAWCGIGLLHPNVRACEAFADTSGCGVSFAVTATPTAPAGTAQSLRLLLRPGLSDGRYRQVSLSADAGPLLSRGHRMTVETLPVSADRTLVHLRYAYNQGPLLKTALKLYLQTAGRHKVGFSRDKNNHDQPVRGVKGLVERNAVRYLLAVQAYAGEQSLDTAEERLATWFEAASALPPLRELSWEEYRSLKHDSVSTLARAPSQGLCG